MDPNAKRLKEKLQITRKQRNKENIGTPWVNSAQHCDITNSSTHRSTSVARQSSGSWKTVGSLWKYDLNTQ